MAEEIETQVDEKKPSRKLPLKWIFIGAAILIVIGGGYAGWTMVRNGSGDASEPSAAAVNPSSESAVKETEVGLMFDMDPFIVNLNEQGGKRYLKAKIGLEFADEKMRPELTSRLPQLRDVILLHLSSKTFEEIQGVEGKIELKNTLIARINQVLKGGKIRNLYFTQFVIQ